MQSNSEIEDNPLFILPRYRCDHIDRHLPSMFLFLLILSLDDFNYLKKKGYERTESTRYVGRAIVALASDPKLIRHTGKIYVTGELARMYQFKDLDGTQPEYYTIPDKSDGISQR
ncbi:MAG: hypothetical protein ACTSXA_09575 [Candidatus Heimdallarchaeota archaeon]